MSNASRSSLPVETRRVACGFCLRTLDSEETEPGRAAVVTCQSCSRLYHRECAPPCCTNPAGARHNLLPLNYAGMFLPVALDAGRRLDVAAPATDDFQAIPPPPAVPLPLVCASAGVLLLALFLVPVATALLFLLGILFALLHRELRFPKMPLATYRRLCAWSFWQAFDGYRLFNPLSIVEGCLFVLLLAKDFPLAMALGGALALSILGWHTGWLSRGTEAAEVRFHRSSRLSRPSAEWWSSRKLIYLLAVLALEWALFLLARDLLPDTVSAPSVFIGTIAATMVVGGIGITAAPEDRMLARVTQTLSAAALLLSLLVIAIGASRRLPWPHLSMGSDLILLFPALALSVPLARGLLFGQPERSAGVAALILVYAILAAEVGSRTEPDSLTGPFLRMLAVAVGIVATKVFLFQMRDGAAGELPRWASLYATVSAGLLGTILLTFYGGWPGLIVLSIALLALWRAVRPVGDHGH